MRIKLNDDLRKFIDVEVEVGEEVLTFKYYEKNTRQIRELKKAIVKKEIAVEELDAIHLKHFDENFQGKKEQKKRVKMFYEEKGNLYGFMSSLDKELARKENVSK